MVGKFSSSAILASLLASGGSAQAPGENPIHLITEPAGNGVRILVVGASDSPVEARYTLEVDSGSSHGNRSVQRGTVRLQPNVPATLINLTLGAINPDDWSAKLKVEPSGGATYEEMKPDRR